MADMIMDMLDSFTEEELADLLRIHVRDRLVLSDAGLMVVNEVIRRLTCKDTDPRISDDVPGPDSMENMHLDLLTAAVEIGGIVDMPHWMSAGIAGRLMVSRKSLDQMTVHGLVKLMKEQEKMHAGMERAACGQEE